MEPNQPPEGTRVRRLYEPCTHYPRFRAFAESSELLDCIEDLLEPNLMLHYSKLNMKPPAIGSVVEWHQDLAYYPLTNRDSLAVLAYLDDADIGNGCPIISARPGSCRRRSKSSTHSPAGGFNQAVNLGCTGAPAHSVCAVNPNSLTPSGSGTSTATVTVSTAASSEVAPRGPQTPSGLRPWEFRHGPLLVWLAVLAMLGLAGAKALRRYRGQSAEFAPLMPVRGFALGLTLLMALAWAACSTAGPVPARLQGTPAGTYTITLTATDPQANNLSHSATVTLTVTQ